MKEKELNRLTRGGHVLGGFVSGTGGENEEADAGESYWRGDGGAEQGLMGTRERKRGGEERCGKEK